MLKIEVPDSKSFIEFMKECASHAVGAEYLCSKNGDTCMWGEAAVRVGVDKNLLIDIPHFTYHRDAPADIAWAGECPGASEWDCGDTDDALRIVATRAEGKTVGDFKIALRQLGYL